MSIITKLWHLLEPKQKRAAVVLLVLMLIGMVLEAAGIGLIIPAMALLTQSEVSSRYPALSPWLSAFGNPARETLVIFGMVALLVVYFVKALFLAFLADRQARFSFGLLASLSRRLYEGYLRQPYSFHLTHNSAGLLNNAANEVRLLTTALQEVLRIITEALVLFGIVVLLICVESSAALLIVASLGLAAYLFFHFAQGRLVRWGKARQFHDAMRVQNLQQGLGGVKEVRLLGRESHFLTEFQSHNSASARVGAHQATLHALPRLFLELLGVLGLVLLVFAMMVGGTSLEAVVPTIALFAVAAFRSIPAVNRILTASQLVRYFLPVVERLSSELRACQSESTVVTAKAFSFKERLILDHVTFTYTGSSAPAISELSLEIRRGSTVGFLGTSGAGKSTLIDLILGLLSPSKGRILVDDIDIRTNPRGWQNNIGYVPQTIYLTDDTIRRNVAFGLPDDEIDMTRVWRAIRAAQLEEFVRSLPAGLDAVLGERGVRLSGGQRQRIGIARALYAEPALLVLDEATSSLDSVTERGVMEAVRLLRGEKTILIVAHRLSTLEHCDIVYRIEDGSVVGQDTHENHVSAHTRIGS